MNMRRQTKQWSPLLCNELTEDIFSWLPVESLIRFKLVCKGWNSLMSDPYFTKQHLRKSAAKHDLDHLRLIIDLYFKSVSETLYKDSCNVSSLFHSLQIQRILLNYPNILDSFGVCSGRDGDYFVGSCNGLHCCVTERPDGFRVGFWNNAARAMSGDLQLNSTLRFTAGLSCGRTMFGFGYDAVSDKHKVVAMALTKPWRDAPEKTEMKVHVMGDSRWRNLENFPDLWSLPKVSAVYLCGTLNWVLKTKTASVSQTVIFSVELENETCTSLSLPTNLPNFFNLSIGVFRDSLCVWLDNLNNTHLVMWQMKEFGDDKSWIQLLNFSHDHLEIPPYELLPMFFPLCMSENGNMFMLVFNINSSEYRTVMYNERDGRLQIFSIPACGFTTLMGLNLKISSESLLSLA